MRTLKECYELTLNRLNESTSGFDCICGAMGQCSLTEPEYSMIKKDFFKHKPRFYNKEYWHKNFNRLNIQNVSKNIFREYWWSLDKTGLERRRLSIQKRINSL